MKKYICPIVSVEDATVVTNILATSDVVSGDLGIGYGGVDGSGDQTPSVKEGNWDIWGDE